RLRGLIGQRDAAEEFDLALDLRPYDRHLGSALPVQVLFEGEPTLGRVARELCMHGGNQLLSLGADQDLDARRNRNIRRRPHPANAKLAVRWIATTYYLQRSTRHSGHEPLAGL